MRIIAFSAKLTKRIEFGEESRGIEVQKGKYK